MGRQTVSCITFLRSHVLTSHADRICVLTFSPFTLVDANNSSKGINDDRHDYETQSMIKTRPKWNACLPVVRTIVCLLASPVQKLDYTEYPPEFGLVT